MSGCFQRDKGTQRVNRRHLTLNKQWLCHGQVRTETEEKKLTSWIDRVPKNEILPRGAHESGRGLTPQINYQDKSKSNGFSADGCLCPLELHAELQRAFPLQSKVAAV